MTLEEYRALIGGPPGIQPTAAPSQWQRLIAAATELFEQQRVTHYYTLTLSRPVGSPRARSLFMEWTQALEWLQGEALGWLRADESIPARWSGCGEAAIPLHYHGLLIAAPHLGIRQAQALWRELAGDSRIEPYIYGGGAVPYSLKKAFGDCGDYELGGSDGAFRRFLPS